MLLSFVPNLWVFGTRIGVSKGTDYVLLLLGFHVKRSLGAGCIRRLFNFFQLNVQLVTYSGLKDFVELWALKKKNRGGLTSSLHPQGPPGCTKLGTNIKYAPVFFSSAGLWFCRHQTSNCECHRPNWGMQGVEVLFASWNSQEKLGEGYLKVSTSQGPHVCIQRTPVHGQKLCPCLPLGTSPLWAFCFVGTSFWRLSMSP